MFSHVIAIFLLNVISLNFGFQIKTLSLSRSYCSVNDEVSKYRLHMAGFGKKEVVKIETNTLAPPISNSEKCICGSGKSYGDCCKPFHDNLQEASNLVQLIRGRFSALNYGVSSYLIKTTHPDNKEYVSKDDDSRLNSKKSKFTIWEREVRF